MNMNPQYLMNSKEVHTNNESIHMANNLLMLKLNLNAISGTVISREIENIIEKKTVSSISTYFKN